MGTLFAGPVAVRRVKRGPGCVTAWSRVGSTQVYWAHFASNLKHATTRAYPPTETSALQCRSHLKAKTKREPLGTSRDSSGYFEVWNWYLEMPHLGVPSSMEGSFPMFSHRSAQLQQQIEFSTQKCLKREISQFLCTGLLEPTSTTNLKHATTSH